MNTASNLKTRTADPRTSALPTLIGAVFAALLLPAFPASAASHVTREPSPAVRLAGADATTDNNCFFPPAPLQVGPSLFQHAIAESAGSSANVEGRWTAGATSASNAGLNRVVDRLVNPPENVNVYAVQSRLNDRFGVTRGPEKTLAGFEIVLH